MKIKTVFMIIIFTGFILFPLLTSSTPQEEPVQNRNPIESDNVEFFDDIEEPTDDEEIIFSDQELFSRKLFQKTLPPLNKKQKIIWAFRMSEHHLFL